MKRTDDLLWYFKLGDVASIDKISYTSKPERNTNPTGRPGRSATLRGAPSGMSRTTSASPAA